jgi:hypothetical protein
MAEDKAASKRKSRKQKIAEIREQVIALDDCESALVEVPEDFCSLAEEIENIKNRIRKRRHEEAEAFTK